MRPSNIENLVKKIGEEFKKIYLEDKLSKEKIASHFNICEDSVNKLIKYLDLKRDRREVTSKSLSNNSIKLKHFKDLINRVPKEELIKYYIEEDHGYYETIKHFNTTDWSFYKLIKYYNIDKKDKSKVKIKSLSTIENPKEYWKRIVEKIHNTRIVNSGSLEESYSKQQSKIRQTNLEKYGSECIFNSDYIKKIKHKVYSKPNEDFRKLLDLNNIKYEREFNLGLRSYDFKVNNCLIEINPYITHNSNFNPFDKEHNYIGIDKKYHLNKTKLALDNGYKCIHIWDWDDKEKIVNLLKTRETIYARECEVKEVNYNTEIKNYCNRNHIQGWARCSIRLGLYYNNELISIMTFGKPRYNKHYEYELIRYCSSKNVIGGAEKLFKHFLRKYNPQSIISYCDNSKFTGDIYYKLGFKLKFKGIPTCHWYDGNTHITDALLRQKGFSRLINHCEPKEDNLDTDNNEDLMRREGFFQIYDCGQSLFEWYK